MTVMLATSVYLSTDVLAARWRDRVRGRGEKEVRVELIRADVSHDNHAY